MPLKVRDIKTQYERFYESFVEHAILSDCGEPLTKKPIGGCFAIGRSQINGVMVDTITFDCVVLCKNWRWKSRTTRASKRLDILIHAYEIFGQATEIVLQSNVEVSYINTNLDSPKLMQSIHYDYNPDQPEHALFHMQVTDKCVSLGGDNGDLEYSPPISGDVRSLETARFPTPDMTFASVLVCLAADHFVPNEFWDFRIHAKEFQKSIPKPDVSKLYSSFESEPNSVRSWHWFSHCEP